MQRNEAEDSVLQSYRRASELDSRGDERGAVAFYDDVYARGAHLLDSSDREDFYVGYGSTLKNVGRLADSLIVLREGVSLFPKSSALVVFLALTQISSDDGKSAFRGVVSAFLDGESDRSIEKFGRAIRFYLDEL